MPAICQSNLSYLPGLLQTHFVRLDRAAWKANKNISGPKILSQTLSLAGFNGDALLAAVTTGPRADLIKATLKRNNDEALKLGICGAPSYQVGEHLVWGQDRVKCVFILLSLCGVLIFGSVVEDLIFGWKPESSPIASSAYCQYFQIFQTTI